MSLAVVFDLGKVLLDFDYSRAASNLAQHCSVPHSAIVQVLNQSALLHQYETGQLTTESFFHEVRRATSFCRELEHFEPLFGDIFTPVPEMIALHRGLRARAIPTFIFSNTNEMAVRHIRARYPFFNEFDGYILSYEQGAMKPHPSIYEAVERLAGLPPASLVYIDDRLENIETAVQRGWHAIHHLSPDLTIPRVQARIGSAHSG